MEDAKIIELFLSREEQAIAEAQKKYGAYCFAVSYGILQDRGDAEECVNDTLLSAWKRIPPEQPRCLSAYLGRIARNLSLKKWRARNTQKRKSDETSLTLHELEDCLPARDNVEDAIGANELARLLERFLRELPDAERRVFLRRYWYHEPVAEIGKRFGFGESKVKVMLFRTREKLRKYLERNGIPL